VLYNRGHGADTRAQSLDLCVSVWVRHGFLHRASFIQRLHRGQVPRHLLTSVCLASAIVLGLDAEDCKTRLADCHRQISEAIISPTLDLLCTILNIIYCEMAVGRRSALWMLSGMANR